MKVAFQLRSVCWLLAALTRQCSFGYPLELPVRNPACLCDTRWNYGWDARSASCKKYAQTSCKDCPFQRECSNISTIVGSGVPSFSGDCRAAQGQVCDAAPDASLSFPVAVAIDEKDNIYFSDQSNNRIRMWERKSNTIATIAGSGQLGYSGDGSLARYASLRKPEGIAYKPGLSIASDGQGREIYFSDLNNHRIRKLLHTSQGWLIFTVAGTGSEGDNPLCDSGCDALKDAMLAYPRALAFSSTQDLYFIDSGNRKIRKLTTTLGVPNPSQNGTLSTLLGQKTKYSNIDMSATLGGTAASMLPGHWQQLNSQVQLRAMYVLNINRDDVLWYVDSDNNRILLTPLTNSSTVSLNIDFGRFLNRYLLSSFKGLSTLQQRLASAASLALNLAIWLPVEFGNSTFAELVSTDATTKTVPSVFVPGTSYWKMGSPAGDGNWCPKLNAESTQTCERIPAQFASFSGIMGFCFDPANNIYVADTSSSQIVYLETDNFNVGYGKPSKSNGRSLKGCKCSQYWSLSFDSKGTLSVLCQQNPDKETLANQSNPTMSPQDLQLLVAQLPNCDATNYCANPDGLPLWCVVNQTDPHTRECKDLAWDFCPNDEASAGIQWTELPNVAILGNELRWQWLYPANSTSFHAVLALLSSDLWLRSSSAQILLTDDVDSNLNTKGVEQPVTTWFKAGLPVNLYGTDMLVGFAINTSIPRPTSCKMSDPCCGLPVVSKTRDGRTVCGFSSRADTQILRDYLNQSISGNPVVLDTVWRNLDQLDVDQVLQQSNIQVNVEDCKSRCLLDPNCKSFMTGFNTTYQALSQKTPCIFYSDNYPFSIYKLDRSKWPLAFQTSLNTSDPTQLPLAMKLFKGPLTVDARYLNNKGIWVSGGNILSEDILGPSQDFASLMLESCQELCIMNSKCSGVAFPGCYLLKNTIIEKTQVSPTMVFVKGFVDPIVKPVVGTHKAYTFDKENGLASEALVNKPIGCAVTSTGELVFADVWNNRIRKISGFHQTCIDADKFNRTHVIEYNASLAAIKDSCFADNDTAQIITQAQYQATKTHEVDIMYANICNYPNATSLDTSGPTTKNMMVLCTICANLTQWPNSTVCPPQTRCKCRNSLARAATTFVYMNCPQQSAYYDPWHNFITAFLTCWTSDSDHASWLTNPTNMSDLQQRLQDFASLMPITTTTTTTTSTTTGAAANSTTRKQTPR